MYKKAYVDVPYAARFEHLCLFLACALKFLGITFFANRLKRRYQRYIDIVVGQRRGVEDEIEKCVEYFERWELENRRYGCGGLRETSELEITAWRRAGQAIEQMGSDLQAAGWPHKLKRVQEIVPSYNGRIFNYGHDYLDNLQEYLSRTMQRLS